MKTKYLFLGAAQMLTANVLRRFGSSSSSSRLGVSAHLFLLFLLLLIFLFLLFLLLLSTRRSLSGSLVLIVRGLGISGLLAGPLSEPLGQLGLGSLAPVVHLLLPGFLQQLRIQHVPAALIELPSVLICPCVCPPLVFGVHADFGRVLASERRRSPASFAALPNHTSQSQAS